MTTANETEVEVKELAKDELKCEVIWWKSPTEIDFTCQNPATHEVFGHSGGPVPHEDTRGVLCEPCLNTALVTPPCETHGTPYIISWSVL